MKVTALIEKGKDNNYSIACDAEIGSYCLGGYGHSVEEVKEDFFSIVKEAQEEYVKANGSLPDDLRDIEVEFVYDLQVFFSHFEWINVSKFAECVGVNASKMRLYKTGKAFASERTKNKIQSAINKMGNELCSVTL